MNTVVAADASTCTPGPVSQHLIAELREEARKYGILVWLDKDGSYTGFVDALLAAQTDTSHSEDIVFPFPLFAYRGSFLELMLALDGQADGVTMQPLLLHMPGFNEEDIKQTPVYELYRAGRRYRLALPTLIRNAATHKATPTQIETALQNGFASLEQADRWLETLLKGEAEQTPTELQLSVLSPQQLFDDLASAGPLSTQLTDPGTQQPVLRYLERSLGLDESWRLNTNIAAEHLPAAQDLQLLMSTWALCVEFVHDLKRPPRDALLQPLQTLPKANVAASCQLAEHIRQYHAELYIRDADQIEAELPEETRHASAEDLGRIDTLRFEDKKVFAAALQALRQQRWQLAADYAAERREEKSFWVRHDRARRTGWQLIALAAELGLACVRHDQALAKARTLEQAAALYADHSYQVDAAQRRLEQARSQLPLIRLEEFPELRQCLNELRKVYRRWADELALAFNRICEQQGFLPEAALQQRTLFDDIVRPMIESGGTVAYFVVDALRFEMGQQLAQWLERDSGVKLQLKPRYAELPTLTEVGMNVLAPVVRDGRLQVDIDSKGIRGFRAGETRIATPKARQKAMHERVGGETCPWLALEDILDREVNRLQKTIGRARLLVVHAEGLDKAGEKGIGLRHFEDELQRLRAAWFRLRDAGVKNFVLSADHGFLLQDETTRQPLAHGRKTDPKRRHVIERHAADHPDEIRVSSSELRYDTDEVHFMFPRTSMPFDTGAKTKEFLHGGNSLQERLIPVLTARYRHAKGGTIVQYRVDAEAAAAVMGLHCIKGKVRHAAQQGLDFGGDNDIELLLHALDDPDITVELVDVRNARIEAGVLAVTLDQEFEVFFRLSGIKALRTRMELRAALSSDEVIPAVLERRFAVDVISESKESADTGTDWLDALPEGVRSVFAHIQQFGAINEQDATGMLGGPRQFRKFSREFEQYAEKIPFALRIDVSSGQKRYVREG